MCRNIAIGIDIGGTNTVLGFVDEKGNYLLGNTIPTYPKQDAKKFVSRLVEFINEQKNKHFENDHLTGIGVAAPSANHFSGTIETPYNLNWRYVKFVDMLKDYFDLPVAITNDANAAALGELAFGNAVNMKNFIMLTLGTGLGSGIIINGSILYGKNGHAGEMGHMTVIPNGRECACGRCGCLETYVSAKGLKRTVYNMLSKYREESELRNINYNELTGEKITKAALNDDYIALKSFEYTSEILGKFMANITACFEPEAFILFGGMAEAGDLLLEPARKHFEENLLEVYKGKVAILKSKFKDGKAAVLGACSLVAHKTKFLQRR
ncbi:MAG: ROK family protein [Ignavibacteria bacterium]|jgi:glucokinase